MIGRSSPVERRVSPPRLTLIQSVPACDVRDAADAIPIPLPITMCPWEQRKTAHAIGLERPPGLGTLRMSRVTQRRFGAPDQRVPDRLAIGTLVIAQPAKPGQVADRSRTDHH